MRRSRLKRDESQVSCTHEPTDNAQTEKGNTQSGAAFLA